MAGIGEASAIISFVSTAAKLSKTVVEIANQYKDARAQIESFGRELGIFSKILDQLNRLQSRDASSMDISVRLLITEVVDECYNLFSQIEAYNDKLYGKSDSLNPNLRGKTKWVFQAAELEYLRARVDSMKINLLLMMTFQAVNGRQESRTESIDQEHAKSIQNLSSQNDACLRHLQSLEEAEEIAVMNLNYADESGPEASIKTFETAGSIRTIRDSILDLYDDTPYSRRPFSASSESFVTAYQIQESDSSTVSNIVEDYLNSLNLLSARDEAVERQTEDEWNSQTEWQGAVEPILCFDDGGIRTYSALLILQRLMAEVAALESSIVFKGPQPLPNPRSTPESRDPSTYTRSIALSYQPCRYFDYIVGASTGGLLAMMLGRYKMTIQECLTEFRSVLQSMFHAPRIVSLRGPLFWPKPRHDYKEVEAKFKFLEDCFFSSVRNQGEEGTFKSGQRCKTIALAPLNSPTDGPHVFQFSDRTYYPFRSYHQSYSDALSPTDRLLRDAAENLKPWEISRALIAKQSYFSSFKIPGGEFEERFRRAFNPAIFVAADRHNIMNNSCTCLISIGSGFHNFSGFRPWPVPMSKKDEVRYTRLNAGQDLSSIKYDEWEMGVESTESTIDKISRITQAYLSQPSIVDLMRRTAKYLVMKRRDISKEKNKVLRAKWQQYS